MSNDTKNNQIPSGFVLDISPLKIKSWQESLDGSDYNGMPFNEQATVVHIAG